MSIQLVVVVIISGCASSPDRSLAGARTTPSGDLRVMTWNIWHGGREDGEVEGPARAADVIRRSGADVVAIQETYGSGELIARTLGYHLLARGTNVSILSRYPIVEDISVFEPFKCVGALIERDDAKRVAVYSVWLPYDREIWEKGTRPRGATEAMLAACRSSAEDLEAIRVAIDARLAGSAYADIPIIIGGDFNSMSHLDYAEVARDQYGDVVPWSTSRVLIDAGYRDAYREAKPSVNRAADRTWTPRFPEQEQDRIDFVYFRGEGLAVAEAEVVDEHPHGFPSDHAAVLATIHVSPEQPPSSQIIRAVSYNIRHGRGMDDKVDLDRSAAALARLAPDIVGLQEVDLGVRRSGSKNQAAQLAERLGMHAAFGAFMELQGGWYGMGILSRFPLVNVRSIPLPEGNEPRVALAADVRLPDGTVVHVVNVHFDWVDDDGFRFAQAAAVADHLRRVQTPVVLLGDFNDGPDSRTLALFRRVLKEANKPSATAAAPTARLTWSSTEPVMEIDYIFVAPPSRWVIPHGARVIDDPLTSDHRAVVAEIELTRQVR
jgi:endonuclease/exonuclease/phosphatase family metal-dependent hydrolase